MSDLCGECFPPAADLVPLAARARAEGFAPVAGDGSPDTQIGCPHGSWRLGDVLDALKAVCGGVTKAGEPCKAPPKADSVFCVAHQDQGQEVEGAPEPVPAEGPQEQGQATAGG